MEQIQTVADMMKSLQEEIEEVKAGKLTESKARVIGKFRGLQLKTAELQLQYARMMKGRLPEPFMPLLGSRVKRGKKEIAAGKNEEKPNTT